MDVTKGTVTLDPAQSHDVTFWGCTTSDPAAFVTGGNGGAFSTEATDATDAAGCAQAVETSPVDSVTEPKAGDTVCFRTEEGTVARIAVRSRTDSVDGDTSDLVVAVSAWSPPRG